ncbi:MAG: hypothetical protein IJU31_06800 [Synergistaceae bacterium]|nr:hypothetical protein [Synergistaceae bacterium]
MIELDKTETFNALTQIFEGIAKLFDSFDVKQSESNGLTLNNIRRTCAKLAQDGRSEEIKELIKNKYGHEKLSELQPSQYQKFIEDLAALK